ncbi:DUF6781 family protein [Geobacter grbiciae]|uniref:DUF6781 family protein n=1 Tax=Geobacter grbiciae TaxID=155042 RepID=UPI001C02C250|nr:DUF6781 family protein [Geobacter grbiciae]MBT1077284.1 hypothetical protein [Geobacter grbiciae]
MNKDTFGDNIDNSDLESDVRNAVEQGNDVQEMVRKFTVSAISTRSIEIESLRQIATEVLRGAREGAQNELRKSAAQTETARERLKQAVTGLDAALAQFAEASKLALEEAAGHAQKFPDRDLAGARVSLESLETIYLEALHGAGIGLKDTASEILRDLAMHAQINGSTFGAQVKNSLVIISHQLANVERAQVATVLNLAQATSNFMRQIAAGALSGLSDSVKPCRQSQDKVN